MENIAIHPATKSLVESNKRVDVYFAEKAKNSLVQEIKESCGVDISDKKVFDWTSPGFSFRGMKEACIELNRRLGEKNAAGTFGMLLRAGVQTIANDIYQHIPTTYQMVVRMAASNKRQEFYAPTTQIGYPKRTGKGERFKEATLVSFDIELINEKFGVIVPFERELIEDDQTGVIQQRAGQIGEGLAKYKDAYTWIRFIGKAGEIAGDPVPASPNWSNLWQNSLPGGGSNRPATYQRFAKTPLQDAFIALQKQVDIQGTRIAVQPDTVVVSPIDRFDLQIILNSNFYPAAPGNAGTTGGMAAINPLQGIATPVVTPWLPDYAWGVGEAAKGMIFQVRDPDEVVQENPASGNSFYQEVYNFRSRSRFEVDWVTDRFWYLGNDGSVS